MRRATRFVIAFVIVLFTAAGAQAVTLKDIVDLTRAGLGEDVPLALIEVDGGVFDVDTATLTRLKAAGVSEKVIVALVRSGRSKPVAPEPQPLSDFVAEQQAPEPAYQQHPPATTTIIREVGVPYPVYVGIPVSSRSRHGRPASHAPVDVDPAVTSPSSHGGVQWQTDIPPRSKHEEPVYWGWGGKLRPDAWKPKD